MVERPQSCSSASTHVLHQACHLDYQLQQQLGCTKTVSLPSQLIALILVIVACPLTFSSGRRGRGSNRVCSSFSPPLVSPADKAFVLQRLPENAKLLASGLPVCDKQILAYLMDFGHNNPPNVSLRPCKNGSSLSVSSSPRLKFEDLRKQSLFSASSFLRTSSHQPSLCCDCFTCYCCFWGKWNASKNRDVIDEVLDLFDSNLEHKCLSREHGKQEKVGSQKRGKELENSRRGKTQFLAPIVTPNIKVGSSSAMLGPFMDQKFQSTSNHSLIVHQQKHHQRVGKHRKNQVIPLNIDGSTTQKRKKEAYEGGQNSVDHQLQTVVNVRTIGVSRVAAGDSNLRGIGFLGRVFPDALAGLALRLWSLVSLRMRDHSLDFY